MANLDLSKYGIVDVKEILHNPSYEVLFEEDGGLLMNIRMTTNPALKRLGLT